jgi:hypothetical protein
MTRRSAWSTNAALRADAHSIRHLAEKIETSATSWAKRRIASVRISTSVLIGRRSEEYGRPWRLTKTAGS